MKKVLYLGTSPDHFYGKEDVLHYPVISLIPKSVEEERVKFCLSQLPVFSHCLITSKNSVEILWDLSLKLLLDPTFLLQNKCISIGSVTSEALRGKGVEPVWQAVDSTQEGLIETFSGKFSKDSYVFYPRSSMARSLLSDYLIHQRVPHEVLDLYDTSYQELHPKPDLNQIKEIVFTSSSTVEGFFRIFKTIPLKVKISFQGPITERKFHEKIKNLC